MTTARSGVKRDHLRNVRRPAPEPQNRNTGPDLGLEVSSGVKVGQKRKKMDKVDKGKGRAALPLREKGAEEGTFEVVVLGSGGGPLETDVSGYLLKPLDTSWEQGFVALEGGSGIGSLTDLMERYGPRTIFPSLEFPSSHSTALLKAAYVFSFLSCYLLTHAHLDHCQSLILFSGSMPPRQKPPAAAPLPPTTSQHSPCTVPVSLGSKHEPGFRPPIKVYGTRGTLQKLSLAYGGELWPELVEWDTTNKDILARRKSLGSQAGSSHHGDGPSAEMILSPLPPDATPTTLDPALPLTVRQYEISHGCTSKGSYESTALFIRSALPSDTTQTNGIAGHGTTNEASGTDNGPSREILFFGDVESSYRPPGSETIDTEGRDRAERCNAVIWKEAAKVYSKGRLAGIFIECSYDSERPIELMFGHMSPLGVMHELGLLAREMATTNTIPEHDPPLSGFKVYITHIKQYLVPHPSGLTANERIMAQLRELEQEKKLGIEFIEVKRGMRIVL